MATARAISHPESISLLAAVLHPITHTGESPPDSLTSITILSNLAGQRRDTFESLVTSRLEAAL